MTAGRLPARRWKSSRMKNNARVIRFQPDGFGEVLDRLFELSLGFQNHAEVEVRQVLAGI